MANTRPEPIQCPSTTVIAPKPDPTSATGHAGLQLQHLDELGRIEPGLPALLRDLRGIGLLCIHGADCAEHDEHLEQVLTSHHGEWTSLRLHRLD
jgi:hypothetical protein